jgi:hypothetical protein
MTGNIKRMFSRLLPAASKECHHRKPLIASIFHGINPEVVSNNFGLNINTIKRAQGSQYFA